MQPPVTDFKTYREQKSEQAEPFSSVYRDGLVARRAPEHVNIFLGKLSGE